MKDINEKEFAAAINEGTVLIDFNADWCGPCQMMRPILEEFAEKHQDVKVYGINIDAHEDLADAHEVSTIPCVVLFKDGKEVARTVGVQALPKLEKFVGV